MYKNATYKEKFADLKEWMPIIIDSVKKDLRNDHLKKDLYFVKKFLSSKNIQKVTTEELTQAYQQAIQEEEKGEEIAEFIVSRWLLKNTELYNLFETNLSRISSDFTVLEDLSPSDAQTLAESSTKEFGPIPTYLFAVLNSVVFPKETFDQLKRQAKDALHHQSTHAATEQEKATLESMQRACEREIARIEDKYEKKLAGMQKKYLLDVEQLKKQMAALQRKLQAKDA